MANEEQSMKYLLHGILAAGLMIGLAGCDDVLTGSSDSSPLTFENASRLTVEVIPLTTEWGGFVLQPMDTKKMKDIRDIDFRYEPDKKVNLGSASTERHIVFVDAPPDDETLPAL
jgi:hypothetical protein